MHIVITISGLHGTGKSTYAKALAKKFGLRHISAGGLFRNIAEEKGISVKKLTQLAEKNKYVDRLIDERTKKEAKKGSVIIDGSLAGWIAKSYADIKMYLKSPLNIRIKRIAERDGISYKKAEKATLFREKAEKKRFKKFYEINIDDTSIYDYIINTSLMPLESNIKYIRIIIHEYISNSLGG